MKTHKDIVVIGNSSGQGVLRDIRGHYIAIGPTKIEIDAKFISGNSGGPIISYFYDAVVGIATEVYAPIEVSQYNWDTEFVTTPRRFGTRIDNIELEECIQLDWDNYLMHLDNIDTIMDFVENLREDDFLGSEVVSPETHRAAVEYAQYLEETLPRWMLVHSVQQKEMYKILKVCQLLAQ
jgi:hypothetical protein